MASSTRASVDIFAPPIHLSPRDDLRVRLRSLRPSLGGRAVNQGCATEDVCGVRQAIGETPRLRRDWLSAERGRLVRRWLREQELVQQLGRCAGLESKRQRQHVDLYSQHQNGVRGQVFDAQREQPGSQDRIDQGQQPVDLIGTQLLGPPAPSAKDPVRF